jgi:RNA polymerase sigma factor (sigma-70 family)
MAPRPSEALLSLRSDEQLARLVHEGNVQAFAVIVERYRRELHAFAGRIRADGRADDLVQQTFLSALTALRGGTEVKHLRGWLYRILRNEATRTSRRTVVEVELDPGSITSESLEEATQRRMLAFDTLSSIAALPDRQRHVLVASALGGESRAAVAGSMGLSEGAVRQLMHRARATVRAAAAAITPAPLANWMAAFRNGPATNQVPEIAIGAGTAPAAGIALKLGAILASGALATGIVGSHLGSRPKHRPVARAHSRQGSGAGGVTRTGSGSGAARLRGASVPARRVRGRSTAATPVAVLHLDTGVSGASTAEARTRPHDHHRAPGREEGGAGGPGPRRTSGGEDGLHAGAGGGTARSPGGDDGSARSGGSVTEHGSGGDGAGSSESGGAQTVAGVQSAEGGSETTTSSGDSGSASSDGGRTQASSGDSGSGGSDSRDGGATSSGDSSGRSTRTRDSSGSDTSGK